MFEKFLKLFFPTFVAPPERARDQFGRLRGDNIETPTFNEAWVGGKAPAKKAPSKKKAAPKKRGRPPKAKK